MKLYDFNKKELFKNVEEREINEELMYEIILEGDFSEVENRFNPEFEMELFKLLPKDIVTMGYRCRGCGTWLSSSPTSLCTMCLDNYGHDERELEKNPEDYDAEGWIEYYSSKHEKELFLAFTTENPIDLKSIKGNFKSGKYIKDICIYKADVDDDNWQCQCYAVIYNDSMYVLSDYPIE